MGDATYNKQAAFSLEKHLISGNESNMYVKKSGVLNVPQSSSIPHIKQFHGN